MYNIDLHHMPHASHMMPIIMCNIEEKIITEEKVVADGMQLFRYLLNIETIRKSNYYKHHKKKKVMLTLTATWTLPWDVFYNYVLQRLCSNYIRIRLVRALSNSIWNFNLVGKPALLLDYSSQINWLNFLLIYLPGGL